MFTKILVTGPPRSGTRIAVRIISAELGFGFVDEREFNNINVTMFVNMVNSRDRIAVHCPAMMDFIHDIIECWIDSDPLVIVMRRSIEDIEASRARAGWSAQASFVKVNGRYGNSQDMYDRWDSYQKHLVANKIDLEYESLAGHPLWLPKEKRALLKWYETEVTE